MPAKPGHRGPHPEDDRLFAPKVWPVLRQATGDLCWLLNHGYAPRSSTELVGNRYDLTERQRLAVRRCACSNQARQLRQSTQVQPSDLRQAELWLDGYNVLTGLEAALAGAIILHGCDGCCRDVAGVHRRYRKVGETVPALTLLGDWLAHWQVGRCRWFLDRPVSNSGRLKALLQDTAGQAGWNWEVELVLNPDRVLAETEQVIATADSVILDRCRRWINLTWLIISEQLPRAQVVDLCVDAPA